MYGIGPEESKVGYVFTDKPQPDSIRICEGLYVRHDPRTWAPPNRKTWGNLPSQFIEYEWELPYLKDTLTVFGVTFLCNFPRGPYNIQENLDTKLKEISGDVLVILNAQQAGIFENLLISHGFKVINRTINPKHGSKLVLYHREP